MGSAAEDIGSKGSMGSLRHCVGGSGPQGARRSRCGPIKTAQRQLGSCIFVILLALSFHCFRVLCH